jgi:hypothetical protein
MSHDSLASNPHVFGLDRVVLFFGVVEDRNDPLFLGRCKVRVFGVHPDDKALVTTEQLPWAYPVLPIIGSAAGLGMGHSPVGPVVGTNVVGFFADGIYRQQPFFFGTVPGGAGHFAYGVAQPVAESGADGISAYGPQGDKQLSGPINGLDKGSKDLTTRAAGFAAILRQRFPDLKDFQACAIIGNMWYESRGFQAIREIGKGSGPSNVPPAKGTKNVGYGWAQWTNARLDAFLTYAETKKVAPDSDEAQLGYTLYELSGSVPGVSTKKMFTAFKQGGMQVASSDPKGPHNVDTIEGATAYVMGEYERPNIKTMNSLQQRIQYSKITLAGLNKSGVPIRSSSQSTN